MKTQAIVECEVTVLEKDRTFVTKSYEEALKHYEEGCMVFENHYTLTQPSLDTQTHVRVILRWTNHPEQKEH
jgi:hypothetical protein